jgi:hypothetical protein
MLLDGLVMSKRQLVAVLSCVLSSALLIRGAEPQTAAAPLPTAFDTLYQKVMGSSLSRWEQLRRERKPFYDVSERVKSAKTLDEALRLYPVPAAHAAVARELLRRNGQTWEDMSLAQRHKFLDLTLTLSSAGGANFWVGVSYLPSLVDRRDANIIVTYMRRTTPKPPMWHGVFRSFGDEACILIGRGKLTWVSNQRGGVWEYFPHQVRIMRNADSWEPWPDGIADVTMDPDSGDIFAILRFLPFMTTQPPSVLVHISKCETVPMDLPVSAPLRLVEFQAPKSLAVASDAGEVLIRHGDEDWAVSRAFDGDGVIALRYTNKGLVAVSATGAVAALTNGKWRVISKGGNGPLLGAYVEEDGTVVRATPKGVVTRVIDGEQSDLDLLSALSETERKEFVPAGVVPWGDKAALWGYVGSKSLVLREGHTEPVVRFLGPAAVGGSQGDRLFAASGFVTPEGKWSVPKALYRAAGINARYFPASSTASRPAMTQPATRGSPASQ